MYKNSVNKTAIWDIFANTGNIEAYLLYCELDKKDEANNPVKSYETYEERLDYIRM